MKIMSKKDVFWLDFYLRRAQSDLSYCLKEIKGMYGTHVTAREIESMLRSINHLMNKKESELRYWQQFRNPPNTPKSRRLGWHEKGENNE